MRLRQKIERYYAIWKYDERTECWHPFDDGISTLSQARAELRRARDDDFDFVEYCIVRTTNERIVR